MNRYTTFPTRTPLHVWTIALLILLCTACNGPQPEDLTAPGVSLELARYRKTRYQNIRYDLHFNLPGNRADEVTGKARITFTLDKPDALIADFRGDTSQIHSVVLNGQQTPYSLTDEHIVVPRSALRKGENTLDVSFTADDQSLNRRDDFLGPGPDSFPLLRPTRPEGPVHTKPRTAGRVESDCQRSHSPDRHVEYRIRTYSRNRDLR